MTDELHKKIGGFDITKLRFSNYDIFRKQCKVSEDSYATPELDFLQPDDEEVGVLSIKGDDLILTDKNNKRTVVGKLDSDKSHTPIEAVGAFLKTNNINNEKDD